MSKLDIFGDNRKIPKVSINVKIKVDTQSGAETHAWNNTFGYIMKKPRTKLDFLLISNIRALDLDKITVAKLKDYLSKEDYEYLYAIENLFDNKLAKDLKAFILSILHVPFNALKSISI